MGNEEDELPEEETEGAGAAPAITEEEISNWVPDTLPETEEEVTETK